MSYAEWYRLDPSEDLTDPVNIAFRERFWRDYQPWLLQRGYRLRVRYQPDWVASWKSVYDADAAEDSIRPLYGKIMDATRISDGKLVALKRFNSEDYPQEVEITELFSSDALTADPRNHCVPIYETIPVPDLSDTVLIVMPLLYRMEIPRFDTVGEAVECFRQLFEGVQFIHENNVAHGDCKYDSFMVDSTALFREISNLPHPSSPDVRRDNRGPPRPSTTRTLSPVRYFIIDYNLSRRYEGPGPHLEYPGWGGDKTVPEWDSEELCDPFPVDVYCLGNTIRENFTQGRESKPAKKGFEFMHVLVDDMCQDDPKARPTMADVASRFEEIKRGLSERKLRSRISRKNENHIAGIFRFVYHWGGQLIPICRRIPAIPSC
ncbi:kinase-like domain-containing protein [Mycena galericulata]|nr:kinase-like domain-containing protein [Mycena galericulata]